MLISRPRAISEDRGIIAQRASRSLPTLSLGRSGPTLWVQWAQRLLSLGLPWHVQLARPGGLAHGPTPALRPSFRPQCSRALALVWGAGFRPPGSPPSYSSCRGAKPAFAAFDWCPELFDGGFMVPPQLSCHPAQSKPRCG